MHFYVRVYTAFQHCLRAFQLLSSTLCMHLSISNSVFWAVRKVLERSRNACTQCWNQVGICAHPYCIPALLACIPTTFQYFMRAFLLHSIAFLFHSITFCLMMIKLLLHFLLHFGSNSFKNKRHGPIRNPFDKMPPDFKTSWRDLYDEICSIGPNIERIMSIFSLWDPCAF